MASQRPAKRVRLSPPPGIDASRKAFTDDFHARASKWNLEQDYEQRPRKGKTRDKENIRLPIKTAEGLVKDAPAIRESSEESDSFLDTESEVEGGGTVEPAPPTPVVKAATKQQILEAKEQLARVALLINEDPEEHIGSLKRLWQIAEEGPHVTIQKLGLAAQAAVYRDLIPGYRIRPLRSEDLTTKLSKDVRKTQNYEQSLLSNYQNYIKQLASVAKRPVAEPVFNAQESFKGDSLRSTAISCVSTLLKATPHFNFRTELLKIIVDQLSGKVANDDFKASLEVLESLFSSDEDGAPSLEAVSLITKMMRAKDYRVDESLLNIFLHLRLLSEFSSKGSSTNIDKVVEEHGARRKALKEKREFRTKKQRKYEKERKAVEKDMQEANAIVSYEERDRMQAETLKLVFATYFRILKLRVPNLMGAVLEGLATYAHLINQDFFGDLLEALKDLIRQSTGPGEPEMPSHETEDSTKRNYLREGLLCTTTAFALLSGQDSAVSSSAEKTASLLNLDLSFFISHIYTLLYTLSLNPDVELGPYSLHLPDSSSEASFNVQLNASKPNKVNILTPSLLLLRSLSDILASVPPPPPARLASFTKKLLTSSLHIPEKSTLALLALIAKLTKSNQGKRILSPLWNTEERRGDGVYDMGLGDVGGNAVFGSTVWEGELLRIHYCPRVRESYVQAVEGNLKSVPQ